MNVLVMKCLRGLVVGVSQMERVTNEVVCRRAGIARESVSRVNQRVLRLFGYVESMVEYHLAEGVLMADINGGKV